MLQMTNAIYRRTAEISSSSWAVKRIRLLALILCVGFCLRGGVGAAAPSPLVETPTHLFATEVSVNGVTVWLDIDTASGRTVLDSTLKEALSLKLKDRSNIFAPPGIVKARIAEVKLNVPGYTAAEFSCLVAPINRIAKHTKDDRTRGILGSDFLEQAGAIIDFGDCTIRFGSDSSAVGAMSDWLLEVPFNYLPDWGATVSVRINGKEIVALLDTGSMQTVIMADAALPNKVGRLRGDHGESCTVVDEIEFVNERIGSLQMGPRLVLLWEKERPGVKLDAKAIPRAYIGLDLLRLVRARIDFTKRMIYFPKEVLRQNNPSFGS